MFKKIGFALLLFLAAFFGAAFFAVAMDAFKEQDYQTAIAGAIMTILCLWATVKCYRKIRPKRDSVISTIETTVTPQSSNGLDKHDFFIFKQLANQVISDDKITLDEALALQNFLYKNGGYEDDRTRHILVITDDILADGQIDKNESRELTTVLGEFLDAIDKPPPTKRPKNRNSFKPVDVSELGLNELLDKPISSSRITPKKSYFILYEDAKGERSEREIFVSSIKKNKAGNKIVYAQCKSANAIRSFRLDRIIEAVDLETGEIIK